MSMSSVGINAKLTLLVLCFYEIYVKININLNFYFHTSLWCLKRFYEGLIGTGTINYLNEK